MKLLKKSLTLLLLAALLLCLTGCRLTAEKLEEKMAEATSKKPPTQIVLDASLDITMEQGGTTTTTPVAVSLGAIMPKDAALPYMEIDVLMGEQTAQAIRFYPTADGAEAYLYLQSTNAWAKVDPSQLEDVEIPVPGQTSSAPDLGEPVLDPNSATIGDKMLHMLTYQFSGEQLIPYLSLVPEDMAWLTLSDDDSALAALTNEDSATLALDELDLSSLSVTADVYAEKETYLLRYAEMTISGMDSMISELINQILGADAAGSFPFTVGDLVISIALEYDQKELPAVPEEAPIKAAQTTFNPDMGDGTYVVQEMGAAVRITCPEKWTPTVTSYAEVRLLRNDSKKLAVFTALTDVDSAHLSDYVSKDVLTSLNDQGLNCTSGSDGQLNGYETYWIRQSSGVLHCFAWKQIGDQSYLFVELADATDTYDSHALLKPILKLVSDYQL